MIDTIFPSNNEYDIPTLLIDHQPQTLVLPFLPWSSRRSKTKGETYHFYIDDYRFSGLYKYPDTLIEANPHSIVEPNYSLTEETPTAVGLELIYRKRWLSRYFQMYGIAVWADLYVAPKFHDLNLAGIPAGYNAFFTRGEADNPARVLYDLDTARTISGTPNPRLAVYGGGKPVERICKENNLLFINDYNTERRINNGR